MPTRLDPSSISAEALEALSKLLASPGHVLLADEDGNRAEIPETLFYHLVRIVQLMGEGRAIAMMPEDETFTTQAAANYLGVSRQHLVDQLEAGCIPFHKVGSHRRVAFKDLATFEQKRDRERSTALDELGRKVDDAGLYDASYTGDS